MQIFRKCKTQQIMKKLLFILSLVLSVAACADSGKSTPEKPLYMWVDCEANFERMSSPDSIRYYVNFLKERGFTDVVVDVKSIMGETLYKSEIAPYMAEWEGVVRSEDYDMLAHFIEEGHKAGLGVYGSLNIFCGGHNYIDRGIIYGDKAHWQSQVYTPQGIVPISTRKENYNGMLNPSNPEVQEYQLAVLREFAECYPEVDGVIFDRVRYDDITSDFSELSRKQFEEYAGIELERFPEDIIYWERDGDKDVWREGTHFKKWIEWRASVIKGFVERAHKELKAINPNLKIGDYTGAWYPSYYYVGVNWASSEFDPSTIFDWATPEYKNTGYADLLDVYMTGLYYTLVSKEEVDQANGVVGQRSEAGMTNEQSYWYCIEGGAEWSKRLTCGKVPVIGSIYVEQYQGDKEQFMRSVAAALAETDGLMIFDLVHIVNRGWWDALDSAIEQGKKQK